jgi:hypothetical protein
MFSAGKARHFRHFFRLSAKKVTETGGHPARSLRYRAVFSKKGSFLAGFLAGSSGLI